MKKFPSIKAISERKISVLKPALQWVYKTARGSRKKIENIDIQATIDKARKLIAQDQQMSEATKSMFEVLILVITAHFKDWLI